MEFLPLITIIAIIWYFYSRNKAKGTPSVVSGGRVVLWYITVACFLLPANWIRMWIAGELPKDTSLLSLLPSIVILGSISGALGYYLVTSGRKLKIKAAQEKVEHEQAMQEMRAQPLAEITPRQAILKAGEKAYGAVAAHLQEVQTVGYSAGTSGVSVRVAKGVTLRSGGVRAHAVKGAVIVATGELVITDKRVMFAGDRKSFDIARDQILNVTHYSDGFAFHDSKKTYTLLTDDDKARAFFGIAVDKVLRGA